eukprot:scaffold518884_cov15-Prasinocladus_malaysianus.AAC.1
MHTYIHTYSDASAVESISHLNAAVSLEILALLPATEFSELTSPLDLSTAFEGEEAAGAQGVTVTAAVAAGL